MPLRSVHGRLLVEVGDEFNEFSEEMRGGGECFGHSVRCGSSFVVFLGVINL